MGIAFGSFAVFAVCGGWNKVKRFSQDADNDTSIKLFLLITYLALLRIAYWVTFIDKKKAPETTGSIVAMARWVAWNTLTHAFILFPTAVAISIAYFPAPAWQDIAIGALVHFVLTCFSMSVMLHRYFSHAAYKANRGVTILLAAAACLAYQYGSIATLWFNCKFHPPTELAEMVCNSIDLLHDPLAACHGEAYHKDHHKHPRRAKRPGPDLGYFLMILPLQTLG